MARRALEDLIGESLGVDSGGGGQQVPVNPTYNLDTMRTSGASTQTYSSPTGVSGGTGMGGTSPTPPGYRTLNDSRPNFAPVSVPGQQPSVGQGSAFDTVQSYYQKYLGRNGSQQEIQTHLTNANGNTSVIEQAIKGSPEAAAYARAHTQPSSQGQSSVLQVPNGDFQGFFNSLFPGSTLTPAQLVAQEQNLAKYGIKVLRNASGVAGKVQLPSGQIIDVIQGASAGINKKQWLAVPGVGQTNEFTDPITSNYERLVTDRVNQLLQTFSLPEFQQLKQLLQARIGQLGSPETTFSNALRQRISELNAPVYSAGEENALRVRAFDRLQQMKDAEKRAAADRLMAMGHAPSSGTIAQAYADIDRKYQGIEASLQSDLFTNAIGERQRRSDEATQLSGVLSDVTEGRSREQLDTANALAALTQNIFSIGEGRQDQAVSMYSLLPALLESRLGLANGVFNGSSTPSSALSTLLTLAQLGQNNRALNSQGTSNFLGGLGMILPFILRYGGLGDTPPAQ